MIAYTLRGPGAVEAWLTDLGQWDSTHDGLAVTLNALYPYDDSPAKGDPLFACARAAADGLALTLVEAPPDPDALEDEIDIESDPVAKDWCQGAGGVNRCGPKAHAAAVSKAATTVVGFGKRHGREKAIVVDADGQRVLEVEGAQAAVGYTDAEMAAIHSHPTPVTVVHNHPQGGSLSRADIGFLAHRNVARIDAYGADGSAFTAALKRPMSRPALEDAVNAAKQHVSTKLMAAWEKDKGVAPVVARLLSHAMNLRLAQTGVIRYTATLAKRDQPIAAKYGKLLKAVARG